MAFIITYCLILSLRRRVNKRKKREEIGLALVATRKLINVREAKAILSYECVWWMRGASPMINSLIN